MSLPDDVTLNHPRSPSISFDDDNGPDLIDPQGNITLDESELAPPPEEGIAIVTYDEVTSTSRLGVLHKVSFWT